jgi:hypothetical protein
MYLLHFLKSVIFARKARTQPGKWDIHAEQKNLFIKKTKWYKIWSRLKGWVQKIFSILLLNFVKEPYKSWLKF